MNTIPNFLRVLFTVELFERISYYGVRTLLALFLISHFGFHDVRAYGAYSVFAALVYSTPILSGVLADRIFGFQKMLILGGILIALAQLTILCSMFDSSYFFLGMGLLVVGTGFFKANVNSLLGACYSGNDANRTRGFVFLHVGVNIGSALASILSGYVAYYYGWYYGFSIATLGIFLALAIFLKNRHVFGEHGVSPNPNRLRRRYAGFSLFDITLIACIALGLFFGKVIEDGLFTASLFHRFGLAMLLVFIAVIIKSAQKAKLIALGLLMACLVVFFAMEMQLGSLITLFADRNVSQTVFGIPIPATVSQALNPISIVIIGLMMSAGKTGNDRYQIARFVFGMFTTTLCFGLLYYGCLNAGADYRVSYIYFLCAIALTGLGELIVWPFVQSQITALSPVKLRGFMMSLVMLFMAFANVAGIHIGKFMAVPTNAGAYDAATSLSIYSNGFKLVALYNTLFILAFLPAFYFIHRVTTRGSKQIESISSIHKKESRPNIMNQVERDDVGHTRNENRMHAPNNNINNADIGTRNINKNALAEAKLSAKKKESETMFFKKSDSAKTAQTAPANKPVEEEKKVSAAKLAKKAVKKTAKKVAKKPAAKKPAAKKVAATVAKKVVAKKAPAKKVAAKKVVAKKPVAKKAVAKKATTKKVASKKIVAKKPLAKAASKKVVAKKVVAKKPAAKKVVAKKVAAKKVVAKKASAKKVAAKK